MGRRSAPSARPCECKSMALTGIPMESSPRYPEAAVTRVAKLWIELRAWLRRHNARLGLFFRVTASALLSFELAPWLDLRLPLWAVLTALIVTQMSVGRSGHHRLSYRHNWRRDLRRHCWRSGRP